jgi:L-lactate dehydrogenase complex protein LldG
MSREKILSAVLNNQPERQELPADLKFKSSEGEELIEGFVNLLTLIGGKVIRIKCIEEIDKYISDHYKPTDRIISTIPESAYYIDFPKPDDPHQFKDIELAILKPHFAVAENGAVWITEDRMVNRVVPFICQHLAVLLETQNILADMHEAYEKLELMDYDFGTFIAGPSKTADIEQSLVIGAHGARSMTIFLL